MKVCYFGTYERHCPRNAIIQKGLGQNGVGIIVCSSNMRERHKHMNKLLYAPLMVLTYAALSVRYMLSGSHDVVFVGYPGYSDVFVARVLSRIRGKPLVFDSYLSAYESLVLDRKSVRKGSAMARLLFFMDRKSCMLSDKVLLDTKEHAKYYASTFSVPLSKFAIVPIGADDDVFRPANMEKPKAFNVVFHGTFIPLQGIEFILEAAKLLPDVHFRIIGNGQTYGEMAALARRLNVKNAVFEGTKPYADLPGQICSAHAGLGIFGDTQKAKLVVPNKAYEVMACGVALITADTPAAREFLKDGSDCMLCKAADGASLADAITRLRGDEGLRKSVAEGGYRLFKAKFTTSVIGRIVKKEIHGLSTG